MSIINWLKRNWIGAVLGGIWGSLCMCLNLPPSSIVRLIWTFPSTPMPNYGMITFPIINIIVGAL